MHITQKRLTMLTAVLAVAWMLLHGMPSAQAADTWQVVKTARAGAVQGTRQNSDEYVWRLFAGFVAPANGMRSAPVMFETWASDKDTFAVKPVWPDPAAPKVFQRSRLLGAKSHGDPVDVPCTAPGNAAAGGFPVEGTPAPCIAEEVRRNRPEFDYIVKNSLNTQTGLAAAWAKSLDVQMPLDAISVKADWVPVADLLKWLPNLGSLDRVRALYYTGVSGGVEYAMVSMHVSSRQNPNWVWGTFEHANNPGRCDDLGCFDSFGAARRVVAPNRYAINTQYGACEKSPALTALMRAARLAQVWQNYCLKSSQVDYVAADGTPTALGNSVIERIVGNGTVVASSCIGCHAYASFDKTGAPSAAAVAMLPFNPTGRPIPAVLAGARKFDFSWGLLNAPK